MTNSASDTNLNIIDNIISASVDADFYLSEDVFDQGGNKLLGKGYKVTPSIKDKLINRVLKKPLETSITSSTSLTIDDIYAETNDLISHNAFLQKFNPDLKLEVYEIKDLTLAPLASLLLTVQKSNRQEAFEHTLFMMLMARLIGRKLSYDAEKIYALTIACLLHDIGELYCVIPHTKNLTLENWRSIMIHPVIGSSLIRQHMDYPASVAQAILEHHERNDGSGYPHHKLAESCSDLGKVMIVAEAFSGMVRRDYDLSKLITTLKFVSHDFPTLPYNALIDLLFSLTKGENVKESNPVLEHLLTHLHMLEALIEKLKVHESTNPKVVAFTKYLKLRLRKICQTIYASGLTDCIDLGVWEQLKLDVEINHELFVTINEVEWKIKDLYRDISLRVLKEEIELTEELSSVIQLIKNVDATASPA